MHRRRAISWLAGTVVVLAACGSPSNPEPAAQPAATSAEATAEESAEESADPTATAATTVESATTDAPNATAAADATVDGSSDTEATTAPADPAPANTDAPAATDAPPATEAAEAALPDDGCSADNTATDVAAGPLPMLEVRAASADNPLPDVAVRRVNCAGGWVNFKNELPSDKPLLVWFWAPH